MGIRPIDTSSDRVYSWVYAAIPTVVVMRRMDEECEGMIV